ncbi:hypothetical protein GCM10022214_00250 [Actinomadura miaoliensis]|uniref:SLC26A/SulP transporter domain-containing protein n=1 Tax=Actinomadura miaoliensis TaxID=430685 RepID=A0ABP7UV26_9ACTN
MVMHKRDYCGRRLRQRRGDRPTGTDRTPKRPGLPETRVLKIKWARGPGRDWSGVGASAPSGGRRGGRRRHGYPLDADRELRAFGFANIGAGLPQSITVGASASRTAAMDATGSRSQIPSLVCAAVVAILLAALSGVLKYLLAAALAAIVVVAVARLIDVRALRRLWTLRRSEFAIAQAGDDPRPHSRPLPAAEQSVHRLPGAVALRYVPPRRTGPHPPPDPIDELPFRPLRRPTRLSGDWQQRLQPRPLLIGQVEPPRHR